MTAPLASSSTAATETKPEPQTPQTDLANIKIPRPKDLKKSTKPKNPSRSDADLAKEATQDLQVAEFDPSKLGLDPDPSAPRPPKPKKKKDPEDGSQPRKPKEYKKREQKKPEITLEQAFEKIKEGLLEVSPTAEPELPVMMPALFNKPALEKAASLGLGLADSAISVSQGTGSALGPADLQQQGSGPKDPELKKKKKKKAKIVNELPDTDPQTPGPPKQSSSTQVYSVASGQSSEVKLIAPSSSEQQTLFKLTVTKIVDELRPQSAEQAPADPQQPDSPKPEPSLPALDPQLLQQTGIASSSTQRPAPVPATTS